MDGSSELRSQSTVDGRHDAAIAFARRQFESARIRSQGWKGSGGSSAAARTAWLSDSLPGYEIGPEIHRGGQGVVYRSVQRGTQREVAIKVMHEGPFGGPRDKTRFEREIQILGRLKHPNIVTIHDSGSSVNGFYFVMDYIPGQTLDAFVAGARLGTRETLALFAKICNAVHVAHLRGVIHRDLKPANIRVDPAGEPHVLDFGLAKVESEDELAGDQSHVRSTSGQFIGSLPWASPEQIEGKPGEIDIRTDVYALGVVLFHALTGRMPYDVGGGMRQVVENICRTEPPAPSSIRGGIGGEVDAIVLKCLSKDKGQRYQSAGDMARDIERYLAGEAVEARRGNGWYVLSKYIRRHRVAVAVAVLFAGVVVTALVTSLAFWRQAVRDRDTAQLAQLMAVESRDEAQKQERVAASVTRFLTKDVLLSLDPYNTQGEDLTARALFEKAAGDVEAGAFKDQPQVEFEVRTVLGMVHLWTSDFSNAESQFRQALGIARTEFGNDGEKTALTMGRLGTTLSRLGKLDEAEPLLRQALDVQIRTRGNDNLSTVMSRSSLAGWCVDAEQFSEAEELYRDVVKARGRLQGAEHTDTLAAMSKLAGTLVSQGKYSEAEPLFRETLRLKRSVHDDLHPEVLIDLMHFAHMLLASDRNEEALPVAQEAYDGLIKRMGRGKESTMSAMMVLAKVHQARGDRHAAEKLFRDALSDFRASDSAGYQVVEILLQLAMNLWQQGKMSEAEAVLRDALKELDRVGGHAHDRLRILSHLVNALGEQGKSAEAIPFANESVELSRKTYGEGETTILFLNNYGFALLGAGKLTEAEAQFREALAAQRKVADKDNGLTFNIMHNLSLALVGDEKSEERESLLRAALEGRRRLNGEKDILTLKTIHALATELRNQKKYDEAEALFREALSLAEKAWPDGYYMTEHFRRGLGSFLTILKRFDEAEPLLLLSHENDQKLLRAGHPNLIEGIEKLVQLYDDWGKKDQAAQWRAKLPENKSEDSASDSGQP